jgi:uncharacterized protein YjbI with pentapeptide repeats
MEPLEVASVDTEGDSMAYDEDIEWETCSEQDCIGVRLDSGGKCLSHADTEQLDAALKQFSEDGIIDARGVQVSNDLLKRILNAAPPEKQDPNRHYFAWARFTRATFSDGASFNYATFDRADFNNATFGNRASFTRAVLGNGAMFGGAIFGHDAWFGGATFGLEVGFASAKFGDQARFSEATFDKWAQFSGAIFGDGASFTEATFDKGAQFIGTTFGDRASFAGATFGDWVIFGPLITAGEMALSQTVFEQGPVLRISADRLWCDDMRLLDGASIELRWTEVRLDGTSFGRPTVLAGVGPFAKVSEEALLPRVRRSWRTARPRVLSLKGSDVANLVLSNVDLRACRFTGAHHLDQLRLEATIDFADCPRGLRAGWAVPPLWRWTRRRTLVEEQYWRRAQPKHHGWYPRACRVHSLDRWERKLRPAGLALLYRALRKGREDAKDEPGAADFYYGEMEMRRHDRTAPLAERFVLWLYWLVSGYALRASRALGWLLSVLAIATVLLAAVGFPSPKAETATLVGTIGRSPPQPVRLEASTPPGVTTASPLSTRLGAAWWVALEGAVFRTADQQLTDDGRHIQTVLRFIGPILLGLALLSVRGRVRR